MTVYSWPSPLSHISIPILLQYHAICINIFSPIYLGCLGENWTSEILIFLLILSWNRTRGAKLAGIQKKYEQDCKRWYFVTLLRKSPPLHQYTWTQALFRQHCSLSKGWLMDGQKSLSTAVPVPAQEHLMACEPNVQVQFEANLTSRSELCWYLSCQTQAQLMPGVTAKLNTECRKALNAPNSG